MIENPERLYRELDALDDTAAREESLRRIAQSNPRLAEELRRMLAVDVDSARFLLLDDTPDAAPWQLSELAGPDNGPSAVSDLPDAIGPYRIIRQLGEGGMGTVFLAAQDHPVERTVALKVLRSGRNTQQFIARFNAERRALAMMDHPGITKILDAGTTSGERPWLVMEFVDGEPVTDYCRRVRPPRSERIRLFCDVCAAIQHAHQRGIIHRDIKPSNVMVVERDGRPEIKVIDFGVAKALTESLDLSEAETGLLQIVGTPRYCSPEQISLSENGVDTRSDVYSLGVLLYELITGVPLITDCDETQLTFVELRRRICDVPPVAPSRLGGGGSDQGDTRDGRPESHPSLRASRELDAIVLKALEKTPRDRYQSPRDLALDLQRLLTGEPVQACAHRFGYLVKKRLRRYRAVVATAAVIVASLVAGFAIATWQAVRASRAEAAALESRYVAEANARQLQDLLYGREMLDASRLLMAGDIDGVRKTLQRYLPADGETDRRGFEWFLLNSQRPVPLRTLYADDVTRINAVAVSPDGLWTAVVESSSVVRVLETASGAVVARAVWPDDELLDCLFLDGRQLAVCGSQGCVRVARIHASERRLEIVQDVQVSPQSLIVIRPGAEPTRLLTAGAEQRVYEVDLVRESAVALSPPLGRRVEALCRMGDGSVIIGGKAGVLLMLPRGGGTPSRILHEAGRMFAIKDIACRPELNQCVIGQLGGLATLLDGGEPPQRRLSQLMPANVHSVALAEDGRWIACGDSLGSIHLLPTQADDRYGFTDSELARQRRTRSWKAHDGTIMSLRFLPTVDDSDSPRLVSGAKDGTVRISAPFRSAPARLIRRTRTAGTAFLDDATLLHVCGGAERVDLTSGTITAVPAGPHPLKCLLIDRPSGAAFVMSENGRLFRRSLTPSGMTGADERELWRAREGEFPIRWDVHPGRQVFAVNVESTAPRRHRMEVYHIGEQQPALTLDAHLANDVVFSPDGAILAWVDNNDVRLLDTESLRIRCELRGHRDTIRDIAFSPDGQRVATVSDDRRLICWDADSGRRIWSELAHENRAMAVTFHPCLPTLASVGADATVRFWRQDASETDGMRRLVGEIPLYAARADALAFSPDGRRLVVRHTDTGFSVLTADAFGAQSLSGNPRRPSSVRNGREPGTGDERKPVLEQRSLPTRRGRSRTVNDATVP